MTYLTPTNWSEPEDDFSSGFYKMYVEQFWLPEEIALADDIVTWKERLTDKERWVYIHASAGLNLLDTLQGEIGMTAIHREVQGHIRKATIQFQGMMEDIHAKSYSLMNKTFLTAAEEKESVEWASSHPRLQYKARRIGEIYQDPQTHPWMKMAASVLLESALFYSGFFYPFFLAGQGKMNASGEIFSLITRDEALHGAYIGLLAQELLPSLEEDYETREDLLMSFEILLEDLYSNEMRYTEELYSEIGLAEEVKKFVRYNFNVATDNLGLPRQFPDEEVNPIVLNGINTQKGTHDFFSSKGSSYAKIAVAPIEEDHIKQLVDRYKL